MGTLMLEHGVRYGKTVTSTEVQQQNTTGVQIRGAVLPNHAPPGITVIAHMGIEIPQQNYGVPSRSTFQHPLQGLQEGEDSFELHSVDLELEAMEKQIRNLQVNSRRETNTPTTSTPCASLPRPSTPRTWPAQVSFTPAPGYHAAWMQQQQKTRAKPQARTSPPLPPPVFEISTQNYFAPLREMECDAVIIRDSIVRHVRATTAKGKVHTHCLPGARVLDVSAQVAEEQIEEEHRSCGPPCWHERHQAEADGDPEEGFQEPGGEGTHHITHDEDHRVRTTWCTLLDHFPRSSKESRGSVDYLLLMNGCSHGVKIRNYPLLITGIFSGSVLGSTVLMACTQAELEQQSSQTTSPGHYAPSDW
ncbi:hypothetical protein QTP86_001059 [Hemibagrus guttatus]|nr:hypothetical protein QTP86_001059 [Hemibagrus guttatus]